MSKNGTLETVGEVLAVLGNNNYRVSVPVTEGKFITPLCHLAGKMRQFKINVIVGDKVKVVVPPPYDKGRITFREK
jgi:translation initiation factor IF-1